MSTDYLQTCAWGFTKNAELSVSPLLSLFDIIDVVTAWKANRKIRVSLGMPDVIVVLFVLHQVLEMLKLYSNYAQILETLALFPAVKSYPPWEFFQVKGY